MVTMSGAGGAPSVQDLLVGVGFPISREDLLDHFAQNGAPESMLEALRRSAASRFATPQEVMDAIRGG